MCRKMKMFFFVALAVCSIAVKFCTCGTIGTNTVEDVGEALFLTPYIKEGRLDEARNLGRVGSLAPTLTLESYSGFFTVDSKYNSNMFFWFFPAQNHPESAPLLAWLQGGPGQSSLLGLFVENGPYRLDGDKLARLRQHSWNRLFSMIYIDNPVGAGFSFTDSNEGYAKTQNDVSRNLYELLQQFFTLFPEYKDKDFYLTGQSYAGKYIPFLAHKIHNEGSESGINLKGLAIGAGFSDPVTMLNYADFYYQIGLFNKKQADFFHQEQDKVLQHIRDGDYSQGYRVLGPLLALHFENFTGLKSLNNFLEDKEPTECKYYPKYVDASWVRKAIHVGNQTFKADSVESHMGLYDDVLRSVKANLSFILDNDYKVLLYNGQLDLTVTYTQAVSFIDSIDWKGAKEFRSAERRVWKLHSTSSNVAGYVRQARNLIEILVRKAGHMLPYDQPEAAFDLITRFVNGKSIAG